MKITTLGSSHGDATPTRSNSAILVELPDGDYLIEAGEPVCATLIRRDYDFGRLRAVFVTHMHGDHAGGLPILIKHLLKYRQPGWHCQICLPEEAAIPALLGWAAALHLPDPAPLLEFRTTTPGPTFADDNIRLTSIPTEHARPSGVQSTAYLLEAKGKRVLFTGDLTADFHDFPVVEKPVDLCLCEATHADIKLILAALHEAPLRRLVLTHIGPLWDGGREDDLLTAATALPYPVNVANDGDEFEV
ncbi:MAG: ribonuclease Z [Victivallales bacterium]|nr:ribonuclease Z [Victivallales bacterium]